MELRTHVLLQVDPGWSRQAVDYVAALPLVLQAAALEGAYDVIATLQADSEAAMRSTLALARRTPGLCALRLCPAAVSDHDGRPARPRSTATAATLSPGAPAHGG